MNDLDQVQQDLLDAAAAMAAAIKMYESAVRRMRVLTGAPESPALEIDPKRRYRSAEIEDWRHVDVAARDLGVHPTTVWRWAATHWAQWPETARQVDFNKLRHLRPSDAKNTKTAR